MKHREEPIDFLRLIGVTDIPGLLAIIFLAY